MSTCQFPEIRARLYLGAAVSDSTPHSANGSTAVFIEYKALLISPSNALPSYPVAMVPPQGGASACLAVPARVARSHLVFIEAFANLVFFW